MAEFAEHYIKNNPNLQLITPAQMGIIIFRAIPVKMTIVNIDAFQEFIVNALVKNGLTMVSTTHLEGQTVMKMCTSNPGVTKMDIKRTLEKVIDVCERLL